MATDPFLLQTEVLDVLRVQIKRILGTDQIAEADGFARNGAPQENANNFQNNVSKYVEKDVVEPTIIDDRMGNDEQTSKVIDVSRNTSETQNTKKVVEETLLELLDDDDLFCGFNEPFGMPAETESNNEKSAQHKQPSPIRIGSAEWSRGLITDSNGQIAHVISPFLN